MNYFVPGDSECKTSDGRVYRYCASCLHREDLHKNGCCPMVQLEKNNRILWCICLLAILLAIIFR